MNSNKHGKEKLDSAVGKLKSALSAVKNTKNHKNELLPTTSYITTDKSELQLVSSLSDSLYLETGIKSPENA
jgi:hypothetical protein